MRKEKIAHEERGKDRRPGLIKKEGSTLSRAALFPIASEVLSLNRARLRGAGIRALTHSVPFKDLACAAIFIRGTQ